MPRMQQTYQNQVAPRSLSSSKKNCSSREKFQAFQRNQRNQQKENSYLLATKFGDISQRNQTTCSKQLDSRKPKNDNTQYIRNLYKKYLGKQNNHPSDRKIKTDLKNDLKMEKTISAEYPGCRRQKLNYGNAVEAQCRSSIKQKGKRQNVIPCKQQDRQREKRQTKQRLQEPRSIQAERLSVHKKKSTLIKKNSQQITNSIIYNKQNMISNNKKISQKNTKHTTLYQQLKDSLLLDCFGQQKNSMVQAMKIINGIKIRCQ